MITRLLTAIAVLALASCSTTGLKEGEDIFHDGSLAENTALDYTKVKLRSGSEITRLKVAKDQQGLLKQWIMLRGLPGIINAGGDAISTGINEISDLLE
jgi:hypothetical protein